MCREKQVENNALKIFLFPTLHNINFVIVFVVLAGLASVYMEECQQ
jgi:hypothetical protein